LFFPSSTLLYRQVFYLPWRQAAIPSLNKLLVLELARSEYVGRRENIIAVGNSGTGKTHVALGLGLAACEKGLSVGLPLPPRWSTSSTKPTMKSVYCACNDNSLVTSF
jgi:Cdc6-like AAA superfamily ATPase